MRSMAAYGEDIQPGLQATENVRFQLRLTLDVLLYEKIAIDHVYFP